MTAGRKSLFIFLMGLAWRCRYSMPLLLSGTVAVLGRAWMFQIRVHTVHRLSENEPMTAGRKSLFIFLMGLAWRCRYSMPLLLSGTVAVLGRAWMFQIRVHTVHRLSENEAMTAGRKSLFIFLMGLAWRCRYSMPLLLSGTVAVLGRAWMFQIRVHTVHRLSENEVMTAGRKSLFIFLMGLAWRCRYSMPLLLSGTVAVLGRAWMFQIRVHTVHRLSENELAYYDEEEDQDDEEDEPSWDVESTDSWETIVEEVAYG